MEDLKWWFDVVCYCLKKTSRHPNIAIFTGTVMINPCVLFFGNHISRAKPAQHGGQDLLLPTEHTMSKLISSRQALVSGAFSKGIWANLQWL